MARCATRNWRKGARLAAASSAFLTACAGTDVGNEPSGLKCVDDSSRCVAQRAQVLDSYMTDKSHAWVKEPAEPHAYASGVRLFALSKKRKELSCDELKHAKSEADGAPAALRGPQGSGLTPAQIARGVMLAGDVSRELQREIARRCRKT